MFEQIFLVFSITRTIFSHSMYIGQNTFGNKKLVAKKIAKVKQKKEEVKMQVLAKKLNGRENLEIYVWLEPRLKIKITSLL